MRILQLCIFLLMLPFLSIKAQTSSCPSHPTVSNAQFVGSFIVTVSLSGGSVTAFQENNDNCQSHHEVCVWLMPDGRLDYVIDLEKLTFTGNCPEVDSIPLNDLLDRISSASIEQGILLGYPGCSTVTSSIDTVEVVTASCAERTGNGSTTGFDPCGNLWCKRIYQVECFLGVSSVRELTGVDSDCSGKQSSCEEGCSGSQLSAFGSQLSEAANGASP